MQNNHYTYQPRRSPIQKNWKDRLKDIPPVATIAAGLSFLLLLTGVITSVQLTQNSQDIDTQAQKVLELPVSIQPSTSTLTVGQQKSFNIEAIANDRVSLTAAILGLNYDPEYVSIDFTERTPFLPFQLIEFTNVPEQGLAYTALGSNLDGPFLKGKNYIYVVYLTAKKAGTTKVTIDPNSEFAAIGQDSNAGKIAGDLTLTIKESQQESPRPSPSPSPSPSPGTSPEPSPSPDPGGSEDEITLDLAFSMQGVNREGINIKAMTSLYFFENDQPNTYSRDITYASDENGILRGTFIADSNEPLTKLLQSGEVRVLVKTTTSLRKEIGSFQIEEGKDSYELIVPDQELIVGDMDRTDGQFNKLRITDINRMLAAYTALTQPASGELKELDLNHDGQYSIIDLNIILANYTDLVIEGDTIE